MKRNLARIAGGVLIVLTLLAYVNGYVSILFLDRFETVIYDSRLRLDARVRAQDEKAAGDRIVILDIDQKSLAEPEPGGGGGEGHWPWPRDRLALLLDQLFDHYQIAAVGFDIVFAETDPSSGLRVLEKLAAQELKGVPEYQRALAQLKPALDYDEIFAKSMKNRLVVLGYTFLAEPEPVLKGALPKAALKHGGPEGFPATKGYNGFNGNLPQLQNNAASGGHFNPTLDDDGVVRRVPMFIDYGDGYYEALSLAIVRAVSGSPSVADRGRYDWPFQFQWLQAGPLGIPVDGAGQTLVPYRGPQHSFEYFSVVDVMKARTPIEKLRGKIVLVGTSTPGLNDLRSTPVDPAYPGVEIHANLIDSILSENLKIVPTNAKDLESWIVLVLGLALAIGLPRLTPYKATVLVVGVLLLVSLINVANYVEGYRAVLPLAATLVTVTAVFVWNMGYGYFVEARGRRQITGVFGQYVPPEVVDQIAQDPEKASMRGESREMTVLFTDVRGFTTISEGLEAQALSTLMNEFLTPLTEVIYKHHGTIDKYMGDCIMAFWGAPLTDPDHGRNGVLAGLEMQRTLKALQPIFRAKNWPEIRIGVGLNTGRMSVGNMGSRVRLAYTVMGDAVNLASRLEGITKEYGADIIVGEDTKNAVPDVVFREIDRVRVKGKDTAVTIYEPLGVEGHVPQGALDDAALFQEALELYRRQEWELAELRLLRLKTLSPESRLYDLFLERIALLRVSPPSQGWDGAFTFSTK